MPRIRPSRLPPLPSKWGVPCALENRGFGKRAGGWFGGAGLLVPCALENRGFGKPLGPMARSWRSRKTRSPMDTSEPHRGCRKAKNGFPIRETSVTACPLGLIYWQLLARGYGARCARLGW